MSISRRDLVASAAAMAGMAAVPTLARSVSEDVRLLALLDAIYAEDIAAEPERATSLGLDTGAQAALRGRLNDYSAAGRAAGLARAEDQRRRLAAIDTARLSPPRRLDHDIIAYGLDQRRTNLARFGFGETDGRFRPYVLSHSDGPYREVPDFLDSQHGVANVADAEAWLSRLTAFGQALDDNSARLEADAADGVLAPGFLLDLALPQMQRLRGTPAAETVLAAGLARKAGAAGVAGDWQARAAAIVTTRVFPALDRQIAAVTRLRARAADDAGVWRLKDGEAYYAAAVAQSTTTTLTPDEVHALGLGNVADLSAQLDTLLKGQGLGQGTVGARLVALNNRPDQVYPNTDPGREALLEELGRHLARMQPLLPRLFATLPRAPVQIRRVPPLIQDGGAGAYYQNATLDGSRPGTFFINLKDTFDRPKFGLPTVTFHEAVPGHHMQVMIALESPDVPALRRDGPYNAYVEGWALYAETVADELGFYDDDPLGRIGYLQSLLFRATRLVVDSGLHQKRWSRSQAIDYMVATTGFARERSRREIDRYCGWPGQALGYKVGHTQWLKVRDAVRAKRDAAFDIRRFHDILRLGAMPLVILEREALARA